jgi:hypothetical protein
MADTQCLCLSCGQRFRIEIGEGEDVNGRECSFCGTRNVIRDNQEELFRRLFGMMGSGGG